MGAAVISELGVGRMVSVRMRMGRVSSLGHSRWAVVGVLRGPMRQVIGGVLRQVVLSGVAGFRIGARVMVRVWLERVGGVFPAQVIRRQSRRIVWDLARMVAAVISELGVGRMVSVRMRMGRVSSVGHNR
jgi:hypothetical protein